MQATVSQQRAFGFLDAGESVLWSSVPVLQEALDAVCPPQDHDYKNTCSACSIYAHFSTWLGAAL